MARVLHEAVDLHTAALWERFLEARAPHGLGVDGPTQTLAALAEGRVHTLIVSAGGVEDAQAWFGEVPTQVHAAGDSGPTWSDPRSGALVDVAVRAAVLTDAEVAVLPPEVDFGPEGGLGGICRYR